MSKFRIHVPEREVVVRPESFGIKSLDEVRERCKNDLFYLATDVLGYHYDPKRRVGITGKDPVHKEMLRIFSSAERFRMMLMFRGSYKTTLMISYMIQRLLRDPETTIMYTTEAWNLSRKVLRETVRHLRTNQTLIHLFGEFETNQRKGYTWNRDSIDIAQRQRLTKQPSIMTSGVDSEVTGQHPDIYIFDDVVSAKNITTEEQKQKVIDYFNQAIPIIGTTGELDIIGTPWAFDDGYTYAQDHWLQATDSDGGPLFAAGRMGIIDEFDQPTMPSVYGVAEIEHLKAITPSFEFACQYMCNPVDPDTTLFKMGDVQRYDTLPASVADHFRVYVLVDPAISLGSKRCWTGIICAIPVPPNRIYIDNVFRRRMLPSDVLRLLLDIVEIYTLDGQCHVEMFGIEEQGFQKIYEGSMVTSLRKRLSERKSYIRVGPLHPDDAKKRRIWAMEPLVRHKQVYVRNVSKDDDIQHFMHQLQLYPHLSRTNLDLLDAFAYIPQAFPSNMLDDPYAIVSPSEKKSGDEFMRLLSMNKDPGLSQEMGVPTW